MIKKQQLELDFLRELRSIGKGQHNILFHIIQHEYHSWTELKVVDPILDPILYILFSILYEQASL